MKNKLSAIWRILTSDYFFVFTYKTHQKVFVNAQWKKEHKDNQIINDVVEAIYKQEYERGL